MDYGNYNYNRNGGRGGNNRRRVQSVQDVMNPSAGRGRSQSARNRRSHTGSYETASFTGGIDTLASVIFVSLLCICLLVSILSYIKSTRTDKHYPLDIVTINGVLNDAYAGLPGVPTGDETPAPGGTTPVSADASAAVAAATEASAPTQAATGVTGAAMLLDAGSGVEGYPEAASYSELVTQLDQALAAGDVNFIGSKIGYTDDATGGTLGFPQSVVEHFASFMAANADKRQGFIDMIQDADKYAGMSGTAHIVNLPLIRYKVTTDYDETTFSFSGFSEQTINANQEATVAPMLPCMYTVTATCPSWAQPIEGQLEATFGENLEVNFGTN
ncbi:MAG: hypothetical protein IKS87_03015 [Lachnospiraceae bacterium]|nr:hypothetical protein [Lachnospiraceae bacterium]